MSTFGLAAAAAASRTPSSAAAAAAAATPAVGVKPWLQRSRALAELQQEAIAFRAKKAKTDRFCRTQNILALLFWRSVKLDEVKATYASKDANVKTLADHLVDAVYEIAARTKENDFSQLVSTDNELHNADLIHFIHAASIVNVTLVARQHFWPIYPDSREDKSLDTVRAKMVVTPTMLSDAVLLALDAFYATIQAKFDATKNTAWSMLNNKTNMIAARWFPFDKETQFDIHSESYTNVFKDWINKPTDQIENALKETASRALTLRS